jgi:hypothetical protein
MRRLLDDIAPIACLLLVWWGAVAWHEYRATQRQVAAVESRVTDRTGGVWRYDWSVEVSNAAGAPALPAAVAVAAVSARIASASVTMASG